MIYRRIIIATILSIALIGCNHQKGGHSHDTIGGHSGHNHHNAHGDHDHDSPTSSYTLFSDGYELFVEFPVLVAGDKSGFAAHFTDLKTYKPVTQGKVTVSISKDKKGIRHSVDSPSSPGIFRPALQPKSPGVYQMLFTLKTGYKTVTFKIPSIKVYENDDEVAHAHLIEENGDEVSYSKEQAWETEFATQEVFPAPYYSVIHTSGKVTGQPQSSIALNAPTEGQINLTTVAGQSVSKGDQLAIISSSGIENNLNNKLENSRIVLTKSREDFIRSAKLIQNQLVSQTEYLEAESVYKQDSIRYYELASKLSANGIQITAPIDGYISSISLSNGQYVSNGDEIMHVSNKSKILIEAFVNQSDFNKVSGIFDAHFTVPGNEIPITLKEIGGRVKSKNAFVHENTTRIPVTFTAENNGSFMPGMYLEAFLKTGNKNNALVIPLSSIIEEQGVYYVFVQTGGESFVKREVKLANIDGLRTEITQGLAIGERIVTKGAFQVKLASMAGEMPVHGHTH